MSRIQNLLSSRNYETTCCFKLLFTAVQHRRPLPIFGNNCSGYWDRLLTLIPLFLRYHIVYTEKNKMAHELLCSLYTITQAAQQLRQGLKSVGINLPDIPQVSSRLCVHACLCVCRCLFFVSCSLLVCKHFFSPLEYLVWPHLFLNSGFHSVMLYQVLFICTSSTICLVSIFRFL